VDNVHANPESSDVSATNVLQDTSDTDVTDARNAIVTSQGRPVHSAITSPVNVNARRISRDGNVIHVLPSITVSPTVKVVIVTDILPPVTRKLECVRTVITMQQERIVVDVMWGIMVMLRKVQMPTVNDVSAPEGAVVTSSVVVASWTFERIVVSATTVPVVTKVTNVNVVRTVTMVTPSLPGEGARSAIVVATSTPAVSGSATPKLESVSIVSTILQGTTVKLAERSSSETHVTKHADRVCVQT
jgi:hypothetical protein